MSNVTPIDSDLAERFRNRQTEIPGTERATSSEVEAAADLLREAEVAAKASAQLKNDRAEALVYALQNAGIRAYEYCDSDGAWWTVKAKSKTTVTIKRGRGLDGLDE